MTTSFVILERECVVKASLVEICGTKTSGTYDLTDAYIFLSHDSNQYVMTVRQMKNNSLRHETLR